jgi:hypothetical protein
MSNVKKSPVDKRKGIRFKPDSQTLATLSFQESKKNFSADLQALVITESFGGCGLVTFRSPKLNPGSVCTIQVGKIGPLEAEIRWRVDLDEDLMKLGIKYLE